MSTGRTRRCLAVAAAIAAGLSEAGAAQGASFPDSRLEAANAAEVTDLLKGDAQALSSIWADSLVVTNPLNQFVTGRQVLGMVSSGMLRFTSFTRSVQYVRTYGDIAVLAGSETCVWAGRMPLAGQTSHLRFTAIWKKTGDGWQEVARHANIIPDK